jgi:hypothetical protein
MLIKSLPGELLFLADQLAEFAREIRSTHDLARCHALARKAEENVAFLVEQAKEAQHEMNVSSRPANEIPDF